MDEEQDKGQDQQEPQYSEALAAIANTLDDGSFDSVLIVVTYNDGDDTAMDYARRGNLFANIAAAESIARGLKGSLGVVGCEEDENNDGGF